MSGPSSGRVSRWLLLSGIVAIATAVRIAGLSATALWGDEYRSIDEATSHLGANLTSVLYPFVLRAFMGMGQSVEVLRLPAVLFGVAAVVATYLLARTLTDERTAAIAALLMATSSYAVGYSQQVRFYSLFLLGGLIALYSLALTLRRGVSRVTLGLLIAGDIFCVATDGVGVLLVVAQAVSVFLLTGPVSHTRRRLIALGVAAVAAIGALSTQQAGLLFTQFLNRYQDSHAIYTHAHGLHPASLVKIFWTLYVFAFGERVYPLWLWVTIPGIALAALLVTRGLWSMWNDRLALGVLLPPLVLAPVAMYLVFDTVMPSTGLPSASPRYLIPLLGPLVILVAAGITSWRARAHVAAALLLALALNGLTLSLYWIDGWNYNGRPPQWPRVAELVAHDAWPGMLILVDGRSTAPTRYYLGDLVRRLGLRQANLEAGMPARALLSDRIIVVADTDRPADGAAINQTLDALQDRYAVSDGFVDYPLFAYVLDRRPVADRWDATSIQGWRRLSLPVNVYDLSLNDLSLPAAIRAGNEGLTLVSRGAFALSPEPGSRERTVRLPRRSISQLALATSLQNDAAVSNGAPVAEVTVGHGGWRETAVLHKGREVDDWQAAGAHTSGPGQRYRTGFRWTKLVDVVGQHSYPGAYRQFTAGITVSMLSLSGRPVDRMTFRYLAPSGVLHIWGAAGRSTTDSGLISRGAGRGSA